MLEKIFALTAHKTNVRTECIAGLTTFLTMVYIIFVAPSFLGQAGMDSGAVFVATCLSATIGCFIMGFLANLPVGVAPGMGLLAFFTFSVVLGMGKTWQVALGCVFLSGILFLLVSIFRIREYIINAIPDTLKKAIAAGIGGFLAIIALKSSGIIVADPATLVKLGDMTQYVPIMTFASFFLIVILQYRKVPAGLVLAVFIVSLIGLIAGRSQFTGIISLPPSLAPTFAQMDLKGALDPSMVSIIFAFFFVDLFDTAGTLIGVTSYGNLLDKNGKIPNLKQALFADSTATLIGATLGSSNISSYIESASGVAVGGRTGLTAVVVGILFLLAMFFSPLTSIVPVEATQGALLYISILMMGTVGKIRWDDTSEAAPVAITIFTMMLSYSIADGITLGFITYTIVKLLTGKKDQLNIGVYLVTAMLLGRLIMMNLL